MDMDLLAVATVKALAVVYAPARAVVKLVGKQPHSAELTSLRGTCNKSSCRRVLLGRLLLLALARRCEIALELRLLAGHNGRCLLGTCAAAAAIVPLPLVPRPKCVRGSENQAHTLPSHVIVYIMRLEGLRSHGLT